MFHSTIYFMHVCVAMQRASCYHVLEIFHRRPLETRSLENICRFNFERFNFHIFGDLPSFSIHGKRISNHLNRLLSLYMLSDTDYSASDPLSLYFFLLILSTQKNKFSRYFRWFRNNK